MLVLVLIIVKFAYDWVLLQICMTKMLGRRYSLAVTTAGSAAVWAIQCACKIPVLLYADDYVHEVMILTYVQFLFLLIYLAVFYRSMLGQKLLALLLTSITSTIMEFPANGIASLIGMAGGRQLEMGSAFSVAGILIHVPLTAVAYYASVVLYRMLGRIRWSRSGRWLLCLLLPVSQLCLLYFYSEEYM
ncbi:MAG: hypothetical protein LUE92_17880, partial [Clostridiales bacterium]|nr:hypothetical protein [Clostridiales bacterium]